MKWETVCGGTHLSKGVWLARYYYYVCGKQS